ncbi:MAG: HNH endonuclease [Oscillospiraceae bacterium]|nr:HNH endonuclease [Oscillospiraceae bacterium]
MNDKQTIMKAMREVSLPGEMWKQIPFAPEYYASSEGRIFTAQRSYNRIKKLDQWSGDYIRVDFTINGKRKRKKLHQLIAELFCYGAAPEREVHHINGDKTNNRADNLAFVPPHYHKAVLTPITRAKNKNKTE